VHPDSFDKVRTPRRFPFGLTVLERIAAGFDFAVAIDDAGRAWAWGYDGPGSLGTGAPPRDAPTASPQPVALPDGTRAVDVAAGVGHAAILDQDGSIWTWGIYATSEAQGGFAPPRYRPEAIGVPGGGRFVQVRAGDAFVLALDDAGRAWAWGSNERAALGDGTTASRLEPRPVGGR
jgi:alpha-tubulin suppressor-like RCC1 family protein